MILLKSLSYAGAKHHNTKPQIEKRKGVTLRVPANETGLRMTDTKHDQGTRKAVAQVATSPVANSSKTIQAVIAQRYGTNLTLGEILSHISEEVSQLTEPNSEQAKQLVAAQALVLDQVFHHCVDRGLRSNDLRAMRVMVDTGLRAQRSSLRSLEVMARLSAVPKLTAHAPSSAAEVPQDDSPQQGAGTQAPQNVTAQAAPRKRRDVEPVGRHIKKLTHLRSIAGGRP